MATRKDGTLVRSPKMGVFRAEPLACFENGWAWFNSIKHFAFRPGLDSTGVGSTEAVSFDVGQKYLSMTRRKTLPVLFFVTCWMVGCSTSPPVAAAAPKAVVIVIRMAGGGAPSMQQAALVHKAIGPALTKSGLEVSPTLAGADYVITVTLTPDPANPMKAHMAVSKVEQNLQKPSSTLVDDARARLSEFQRWGESQSAPIYGP